MKTVLPVEGTTQELIKQRTGQALALTGILLVSVNLRTAITALSPIYAQIGNSITLTTMAKGILGMLPMIGFALFGVLTPGLVRRISTEKSILLAMALICVGLVGRSLTNNIWSFGAFYVVSLAGIGMSNVLLPPVIKIYFPKRIGLLTGIYAGVTCLSAGIPPLVAVQVTEQMGWRFSTGMWAGFALIAVIPWIFITQNNPKNGFANLPRTHQPWKWATSWALVGLFGAGAINLYAMIAWLPEILVSTAGVSQATSGAILFFYTLSGLPHSFFIPIWLSHIKRPFWIILFAAVCLVIGNFGLAYLPTLAWVWIVPAGLGLMFIPIGLTLINLRSRTESGASELSGFVQGCGYLIGAIGPFLVGGLHTLTGGWKPVFWFFIGTAIIAFGAGVKAIQPVFLEDTEKYYSF